MEPGGRIELPMFVLQFTKLPLSPLSQPGRKLRQSPCWFIPPEGLSVKLQASGFAPLATISLRMSRPGRTDISEIAVSRLPMVSSYTDIAAQRQARQCLKRGRLTQPNILVLHC